MDDMLMRSLIDRLWPLAIFGICFLVFAKYLSEPHRARSCDLTNLILRKTVFRPSDESLGQSGIRLQN
jgi:hypothetical protein